jgi:asparagine synthase (glutamine-hydrolysing)
MAGIAGILKEGEQELVSQMIETISHRGNYKKMILDVNGATIGMVWSHHEDVRIQKNLKRGIFLDGPGFGHKLEISKLNGDWKIYRDELGVAPMYYTINKIGHLCFASEMKALLLISQDISEIPIGSVVTNNEPKKYFRLDLRSPMTKDTATLASDLLNIIAQTVTRRVNTNEMGSLLSGGLDSSIISAFARTWVSTFHTFSGGLRDAPDLEYARILAKHIGSEHHEIIIELEDMIRVLPEVIFHTESFDALLVRSGIINYLVAKEASGYVNEVFSGDGGDELFAGYDYLKTIPEGDLDRELINIMGRLHNTAFQRADRCAAAHGLTVHLVFADPMLFEFALRIPAKLKIKDGIEKWILRKSMEDLLPECILKRQKAKFWEGAGIQNLISDYASRKISDSDFRKERELKNGWLLNTKEEMYYFRIFREYFGDLENLEWMGRIKGPLNQFEE